VFIKHTSLLNPPASLSSNAAAHFIPA